MLLNDIKMAVSFILWLLRNKVVKNINLLGAFYLKNIYFNSAVNMSAVIKYNLFP